MRAISFDVGHTLLRPFPSFGEVFVRCCRGAGCCLTDSAAPSIEDFTDVYFARLQGAGRTYSRSDAESRATWSDLYSSFLIDQGIRAETIPAVVDVLLDEFMQSANYRLFDDAIPVLSEFQARGFRLGIISNWEAWLTRLLQETGLDQFVSFRAISGVVGFEKPDRRIYDAAIRDAGVPASQILHVGDSWTSDVQGASEVGIEALHLDRGNRFSHLSGRRITSLDQLLDLPELKQPSPAW